MSQNFAIEIAMFCQQKLSVPTKPVGYNQSEKFDESTVNLQIETFRARNKPLLSLLYCAACEV